MTLRTLLGIAPAPRVRAELPLLPVAPFDLHDPCTFPHSFLAIPNVDLRADR